MLKPSRRPPTSWRATAAWTNWGLPKLGVPSKGDYRGYHGLYIGVILGYIGFRVSQIRGTFKGGLYGL